jgi:hypothetical protein
VSKLITISTVAVLMGGTSLALGQGGGTASSGLSERGQAMSPEHGRAGSGQPGKASTAERRAISGEHATATSAERGRAMETTGSSEQQPSRRGGSPSGYSERGEYGEYGRRRGGEPSGYGR